MTREELLAVIQQAKQRGQTNLDLSWKRIEELPPEISQLTHLTALNLSHNQLTTLSESIGQLTQLTCLDLSSNQLTTLPESFGQLTQLTCLDVSSNQLLRLPESIWYLLVNIDSLDLSDNQLTTLPEGVGHLANIRSLDLRSNQLMRLPESIGQLTNLISLELSDNHLTMLPELIGHLTKLTLLDLRSNQLVKLPETIRQLSNLTSLKLSSNPLPKLPESIGHLTNLTFLDLRSNQLVRLPELIGCLTNLTSLDLCSNQLKMLPEAICQLTNLTFLDLSFNQLTMLPEAIGNLENLTAFNIHNNQLTTLPEAIGQLTNLISLTLNSNQLRILPESIGQLKKNRTLNLRYNQLKILPESIGYLTNLTSLDLHDNQLIMLPKEIGQLTNLTALDLSSNQLTALPKEIGQLTHLTTLDLSSNQLTALPKEIGQLTHLTTLDLSSNQLTTLPKEIGQLAHLTTLDFRSNQLTTLPESIGQLTKLEKIKLDGNSLNQIPPEVVQRGGLAVRDYYRQRLEENTDCIYEAKLLIIGEGGAGKTSLAKKLLDFNYQLKLEGSETPELSTEGIDVLRLDFDHASGHSFRINLWDFGGQEIYHATHQFFLTKRSLYLLVADTRQDNTDFNYWLEVVELLSEASPALIIKNEKQERSCQVNENQLRGSFPNLEKVLATNLSTNRGLPEIRAAIQHHISQLPHVGTPLPKTWVNVRKALETDPRNYIGQEEFLFLCDTHGFKRREDKLQLSSYLHDLGVCLHFQEDPVLKNHVILKPEWGTTAVYKVLDTPKVRQNLGCFTLADLATIWADAQYADMRDELLQLMMKFKLCYEVPHYGPHHPKTYIAPQLLSPNQPGYPWDDTDNLILRYHYEFMPKGMLTRFIVEMHKLIEGDRVWKEGVILTNQNARAEVIEAYYRNEIRIRIAGTLKKPFLESIRHEFGKIHESYGERLRYQEFIPCNCPTCKASQTPFSYPLNRLQERLKNNRHEIECDISYQMVSVRSLIDDALNPNHDVLQPNPTNMKIFVSYSHADAEWLDKLQIHLKPLNRKGTIDLWDDTRIRPGADWQQEIETALAAAQVAILLVSPNFIASDFIADNELPPLLDAAQTQGVTILWIPISYSSYTEMDFSKYQSAHNPKQPLDSLPVPEQNRVLVKICQEIKRIASEQ